MTTALRTCKVGEDAETLSARFLMEAVAISINHLHLFIAIAIFQLCLGISFLVFMKTRIPHTAIKVSVADLEKNQKKLLVPCLLLEPEFSQKEKKNLDRFINWSEWVFFFLFLFLPSIAIKGGFLVFFFNITNLNNIIDKTEAFH